MRILIICGYEMRNVPLFPAKKHYSGDLVDPHEPRDSLGVYWGYEVRMAASLTAAMQGVDGRSGYDLVVGTSEHGLPIEQLQLTENIEKKSVSSRGSVGVGKRRGQIVVV